MLRLELPLSRRPDRDGRVIDTQHIPFYVALEAVSDAWAALLHEACGDRLLPSDVGVVHVGSDFSRELFVGRAEFEVRLVAIGRSSVTFAIAVSQYGRSTGQITAVLARVNEDRTQSVPLSEEQRALLLAALEPA